jgi:hypothetical protein
LRWCAFGGLWGLVALSNASLLICLPAAGIWAIWPRLRSLAGVRQVWRGPALAGLLFVLVMMPWWVRNVRTMHAFIATRSNFGVELYESTLESHDVFPWGTALSLWPGNPEFQQYVRMGEVRFSQMRERQAITRLRAKPWVFVRHTVDRFLFFWDDTPHPPERHPIMEYLRRLSYSFLSVAGLLGLGLALRRRVQGAGLMAWIFLLLPLPYYFVTVQARFRHPMEPLIAVLSVYLFRSTEPRRSKSEVNS